MPRSWPSRASSSRCPKPSGARWRSRARRTSAATPCSATSARKASAIGASSSTSAPRSRPPSSRAAIRRGGGCAARTSGRQRLPAMQPTVLAWMRAMDRVGLAVLRALALGLGQPLDHFDGVVLPRGDPHLKIIRYPAQPRAADTGQGVGMHHDSGLVSFVLQDDVGGLQVELDGKLVDATPKPGTYVMNLGRDAASRDARLPARDEASRAEPAVGARAVVRRVLLPSAARRRVRADRAAARARRGRRAAARTWTRTTRSSRPSATTT